MHFAPKRILVPVALEPEADIALARYAVDTAADIAKSYGSTLVLAHAPTPLRPTTTVSVDFTGEMQKALAAVYDARVEQARQDLQALKERVMERGVEAKTVVPSELDGVAERVVRVAGEEGADLVVLCSHGRRGVRRFLLGSVAERIAHLSPVPVMLLKVPEGEGD